MRIEEDIKLDFSDVLIKPKRSVLTSRSQVELERSFLTKHSKKTITGIPIIAANMDTVGTFEMADSLSHGANCFTAIHKHHTPEEFAKNYHDALGKDKLFYSMGITEDDRKKLQMTLDECYWEADFDNSTLMICVDVANGYSEGFIEALVQLRETYPCNVIMAGNVVTTEMTEQLILSGVDIVKVGIGPGSVCTTRKVAGVGYPQLSAIIECADAAHGLGGLICADGGCTTPGDIAKAFAAGADFVMLGGMFAGHDESAGELIEQQGKKYKKFYGMSSSAAMTKYAGGVAEYRASEGKEVLVPYRGPVEQTIQQVLGGVRSACTYVGAARLKDLSKCTTFIRVNRTHNTVFGE